MIEVGMRDQHQIHRRKVADLDPRLPQPFEHKKPVGKIGINHYVLATDLQEKSGVSDESDSHLAIRNQDRFVGLTNPGGNCRMTDQASELAGATAQ